MMIVMLHKMANIPNTTELHALKWLTQYYAKFTSIIKGLKKKNCYYFKVRALIGSDGTVVKGKWSKVKKVK